MAENTYFKIQYVLGIRQVVIAPLQQNFCMDIHDHTQHNEQENLSLRLIYHV